jgi:hypothetical protein
MYTQNIPQPFRRRLKRAHRKLARCAAARIRAGGPPFGASITALRSARKAMLAFERELVDRAVARAKREGVI